MNTRPAVELTDPPGMPEDERMTDAEFKVVRESLGLTGDWLAAHLGVNPRTVRDWEQGRSRVPDGVRLEMERLEDYTGRCIGAYVDALMDLPDPGVYVYRTDEQMRAADLEFDMPATWHRAVIARVALEVPALRIVFAPLEAPDA